MITTNELPSLKILKRSALEVGGALDEYAVEEAFADFGVGVKVLDSHRGARVTQVLFEPERGTRSRKVVGLSQDIARVLGTSSARISVLPGEIAMSLEIPLSRPKSILLGDILASDAFQEHQGSLPFVLGETVTGRAEVADLAEMPHLLVAGTTGSGKSVGLHCMIASLLYRFTSEHMGLLLIDPKRLEFEAYADLPHMLMPIAHEPEEARAVLEYAVLRMEERYKAMAVLGVRDISSYNNRVESIARAAQTLPTIMKRIVLVVDELADLMGQASKIVEPLILRLAQKSRAAGIHLVLATQRPSRTIITGVIKANIPARISFQVNTGVDSRTILDEQGAEHLMGKGDMLIKTGTRVRRVHGAFVSESEINSIVLAITG